MYNKLKAVTFSYDDGITQDKRLIEIFNKYKLKATFNLNYELLGQDGKLERNGVIVSHNKVEPEDVKSVYRNHEVAAHTLTHPNLTMLDDNEVIKEVEDDRCALSRLIGREVVGLAYPCGGKNNDDRVAKIVKEHTGIKYARTIVDTYSFDLQTNLFRFNPTARNLEMDKLMETGKKFLSESSEKPMLLYVWGHSFEFDAYDNWDKFEEFCSMISGHDDIFYGTNSEVLLNWGK